MRLLVAAHIARRELRGGTKGFRVFLACLVLGVASVAAVGSVRTSIEQGLVREGAAILGGDAEIVFSYRFADPAERDWMQSISEKVSEVIDFRSLAVVGGGPDAKRALTQIKGVDSAYPIYGAITLDPPIEVDDALRSREGVNGAILHPSLAEQLEISVGDSFKLGSAEFRVAATLVEEPDNTPGAFQLGPRTIVYTSSLDKSGLLGPGTLFSSRYRLQLVDSANLDELRSVAEELFRDAGLRWRDRRNASPGVRRFVDRLGSFLILVGLAGLAVGGVGIASAVRTFIDGKTHNIATLKTLGADRQTVFLAYLFQVGAMILIGTSVGAGLGSLLPLALEPLIASQLPVPAAFGLHVEPLLEAALYGVLAGLLFSLWSLARTQNIRPGALFRDAVETGWRLPSPAFLGAVALLAAALVGSAAWFSGVPRLALWAAAGIVGALVVLCLVATIVRRAARLLSKRRTLRGRTALRLAFGSIGGPGSEAIPVVLSLGLGLSVLATVGQVAWNMNRMIARNVPAVAPEYFVVDIQSSQIDEFRDRVNSNPGVSKVETAPMLRGVVTRINGVPAIEAAGSHWVLRGDRGITYSDPIPEGTELTRGEWWPSGYSGPPLVSFSDEEGSELGLVLGDKITVNVLGRDIEATITSFRSVDFSTGGLGFILVMNQGAVAGAPHTHIATVFSTELAGKEVFKDVTSAYPNVTAISVRERIEFFARVLTQLAAATTYGAGITLLTGFIVLIGAAAAGEQARVFEAAVLKTLGASRRRIMFSLLVRSAILGFSAGTVAIFAGGIAGWAVMTFVMESEYGFEPVSAVSIVFGGALVTLLAGMLFAVGPLNASPSRVLRARE